MRCSEPDIESCRNMESKILSDSWPSTNLRINWWSTVLDQHLLISRPRRLAWVWTHRRHRRGRSSASNVDTCPKLYHVCHSAGTRDHSITCLSAVTCCSPSLLPFGSSSEMASILFLPKFPHPERNLPNTIFEGSLDSGLPYSTTHRRTHAAV